MNLKQGQFGDTFMVEKFTVTDYEVFGFHTGGGGGLDLLALLAFFPSVISSFLAQNKWGGPLGPSPRSATDRLLSFL